MEARAMVVLLAREATSRLKTLRCTLTLRRCCRCERVVGVTRWPWSGQLVVETHTFCDDRIARLLEGAPPALDSPLQLEGIEPHQLH